MRGRLRISERRRRTAGDSLGHLAGEVEASVFPHGRLCSQRRHVRASYCRGMRSGREIMPQFKSFGSAYDACARDVFTGVSAWIQETGFKGEMHYYFEEGTETESNASYCIMRMMKDAELRQVSCYGGHSFVPKVRAPGIQAADILAWHAGQDCKRALRGDPVRKDFASLCKIPHRVVHITRAMLQERAHLINSMLAEAGMNKELANAVEDAVRRLPKRQRDKL